MPITILAGEAKAFAEQMRRPEYAREERNYKVAVHVVLSRLLSPPTIDSPDFPRLLKETLEGAPDLEALGLDEEKRALVQKDGVDLRNALANLAGGRWGVAQYIWMTRAVEHDLGDALRGAFKARVDPSHPLPERVDRFRDELYEIQKESKDRGGFEPNWTLLNVSLSFVAAVLGAHDPSRYTFYQAKRLRRSLEGLGAEWPQGTAGEKYEKVCGLVQEVADELKRRGVPVRDLIDAQSFLWLRRDETPAPPPEPGAHDEPTKPGRGGETTPPSVAEVSRELARLAFWEIDRAAAVVKAAERSKRLLFYGPPGTGKTHVARALGRLLAGEQEEERVRLAQFHPSYAYEDFVEGIRPKLRGADGLGYEIRKGVLRRLIDQAKEFPEERFFLVIDEMNRANLPRVFGELLFGLEYRGPENPIDLPYSEEAIYFPHNLWLIGTMNTADRSIAMVDAALRRRFVHVRFMPDSKARRGWLEAHHLENLAGEAVRRLEALNAGLVELLDPDRLIGHSYLMRKDLGEVGFETVWVEELEPVLRDHLYSQPEEMERLRAAFLK